MSLDTYIPLERVIQAGGKNISVSPLRVRQIPAFARAIAPAVPALSGGDLAGAVGAHGDSLIRAVCVATSEAEDWVGDLMPDEFMALCVVVIEVNADFFSRRVVPTLMQASEATRKALMAGEMPSPSS